MVSSLAHARYLSEFKSLPVGSSSLRSPLHVFAKRSFVEVYTNQRFV